METLAHNVMSFLPGMKQIQKLNDAIESRMDELKDGYKDWKGERVANKSPLHQLYNAVFYKGPKARQQEQGGYGSSHRHRRSAAFETAEDDRVAGQDKMSQFRKMFGRKPDEEPSTKNNRLKKLGDEVTTGNKPLGKLRTKVHDKTITLTSSGLPLAVSLGPKLSKSLEQMGGSSSIGNLINPVLKPLTVLADNSDKGLAVLGSINGNVESIFKFMSGQVDVQKKERQEQEKKEQDRHVAFKMWLKNVFSKFGKELKDIDQDEEGVGGTMIGSLLGRMLGRFKGFFGKKFGRLLGREGEHAGAYETRSGARVLRKDGGGLLRRIFGGGKGAAKDAEKAIAGESKGLVKRLVGGIFNGIRSVVGMVLKKIPRAILGMFKKGILSLGGRLIGTLFRLVLSGLEDAAAFIGPQGIVALIIAGIVAIGALIWKYLLPKKWKKNIEKGVKWLGAKIWDGLKAAFNFIVNVFTNFHKTVVQPVERWYHEAVHFVTNLIRAEVRRIIHAGKVVAHFFNRVWTWMKDIPHNLMRFFTWMVSSEVHLFENAKKKVTKFVGGLATKIVSTVTGFFSNLKDKIVHFFSHIWHKIFGGGKDKKKADDTAKAVQAGAKRHNVTLASSPGQNAAAAAAVTAANPPLLAKRKRVMGQPQARRVSTSQLTDEMTGQTKTVLTPIVNTSQVTTSRARIPQSPLVMRSRETGSLDKIINVGTAPTQAPYEVPVRQKPQIIGLPAQEPPGLHNTPAVVGDSGLILFNLDYL